MNERLIVSRCTRLLAVIILAILLAAVGNASTPSQVTAVQNDKSSTKEKDTNLTNLIFSNKNDRPTIIIKENGKDMPWLIQVITTLCGFVLSAMLIIWQMRRQHKIGLQLQQENSREALRLKIYQTLDKQIRKVNEAAVTASGYLTFLPTNIKNKAFVLSKGVKLSPLKERVSDYNNKHQKLTQSIINLFYVFESYEIACPDFMIFKIALSSANHDLVQINMKLFNELLEILPEDVDEETAKKIGTKIIDKPLPNEERLKKLQTLIDRYGDIIRDIMSYMYDLRIDAQNRLLDKLFDFKLSPRKPVDPKYKVITTEPETLKELKKYFEDETAWGKDMKSITAKVQPGKSGDGT